MVLSACASIFLWVIVVGIQSFHYTNYKLGYHSGGNYFVYPGASHNRFEHSIGYVIPSGTFLNASMVMQHRTLYEILPLGWPTLLENLSKHLKNSNLI